MGVLMTDWARLKAPTEFFTVASMNDEQAELLCKHLKEDYLYVSDEFRNDDAVRSMLWSHFASGDCLIYEIQGGRGYVGFTDIQPGYKCNAMMKFWGTDIWGPSFIKQLRKLVAMVCEEFDLVRIETSTPDKRIEKLAHMCGFVTEGTKKKAFMWDGGLYDEYILARVKQ